LIVSIGVAVLLLYAYWPTLAGLVGRWSTNPQYSHGYVVPLFSLALLWLRRAQLRTSASGSWWGVPILALGVGMHAAGAYLYFDWLAEASLLPTLAGLALCLGGWPVLRWAWPAIAYLLFMLPLPYRLEVTLGYSLQRLAAVASAYVLQTLGFSAAPEGTTIAMDHITIGVVEACSGLGMLVTFFAMATAVAILLKRPWLDKTIIVVSALPIALLANLVRITATGVLAETVGKYWADLVFHELAGLLMMPLALGMLFLELMILSRLLVPAPQEDAPTLPVDLAGPLGGVPSRKPRAASSKPMLGKRRVDEPRSSTGSEPVNSASAGSRSGVRGVRRAR
jgi:exosortase